MATLGELPMARAVLFDLTPRQVLAIAGDRLPRATEGLAAFRYGPGVHKVDWALDGPIPWRDAHAASRDRAPGGSMSELARPRTPCIARPCL